MTTQDRDRSKIKHRGRFWAYLGLVLGGGVSIAANVAHSYVAPTKLPPGVTLDTWQPELGAVVSAVFWPVALFTAIEILARVRWPSFWWAHALRWGGLGAVVGVAAIVSWAHMHGLLVHYGEMDVVTYLGPVAVDGLMAMATAALLSQGRLANERDEAAEKDEDTSPGDKVRDAAERVKEKSQGLLEKLSPIPAHALAKDVPAVPGPPVPGVVLVGRDTVNGNRSPVSPAKLSPVRDTVTETVPEDKPKASSRKVSPAKRDAGAGTPDWAPVVRDMLGDADALTKDIIEEVRDKVWPGTSFGTAKKRIQRFRKAEAA
jgi:hypothetical protein